jgi:hypothetical protein
MLYLIQGFFFQARSWIGIGMSSEGEGTVALFRSAMCRDMFSGIIWEDEVTGELVGEMTDRCGRSEISKVALSPDHFSFEKNYVDRVNHPIRYSLRRDGTWYIGEYTGEFTGRGGATCSVMEVLESSSLLYPPDLS